MEHFIEHYGYFAIVAGTFLEGETILVLAGFAAHAGYLALPGVIVAAFIGTLAGDQFYFLLGRRYSQAIFSRFPSWSDKVERSRGLLEKHQNLVILGFRFVYGIRTVTPFAIGMTRVRTARFFVLNAIGAMAWAAVFASAGYFFGMAFEAAVKEVERYEIIAMVCIAAAGALIWSVLLLWKRVSK